MPTVFRFLTMIAVLAAIVFAAMLALATFVKPERREISVEVPLDRLKPPAGKKAE